MDLSGAKTTYGYSALHTAVISRDLQAVQALTTTATLGCDLESRDSMGFTALHLATLQGNKQLVQMLVQAGCDINSGTKEGMTSLHISSEYAVAEDIVSALTTASCDVNARNKLGRTALHLAAKQGNILNLKMLLNAGCDRNIKDKLGFTAVGLAFKFNQKGSADILLHYKPQRDRSSSKKSILDEIQNKPVKREVLEREMKDVNKCACTEAGSNVTRITSKQSKELCDKMFFKMFFTDRKVKGEEALSWDIYHLIVAMLTQKRDKLDGLTSSNSSKIRFMETEVFEKKLKILASTCLIQYIFPVYTATVNTAKLDAQLRKRRLCDFKTHVFMKSNPYNLDSDLLVKLLNNLKDSLFCSRNPSVSTPMQRRSLPVSLINCEDCKASTQMLEKVRNCRKDESTSQKFTDSDAELLEGSLLKVNKILIILDPEDEKHDLHQTESGVAVDKVEDFLSCLDHVINVKSDSASFVEDLLDFFLQNSNIFIFCLKSRCSMLSTIVNTYLSSDRPWMADKIANIFLLVCVALANEQWLLLKCAGAVMKQGLSHQHCNAVSLGTCILVRMGLLKGEYDVDTVIDHKGPLLALEHVFNEEYFPRDLAAIFASFLCKSSPKLFGLEELRLRALASAVTREVLPNSAQEAERNAGKNFKRICDIAALEEDRELLSKCVDGLFSRAFVTLECKVWPTGENLLIYLGLLKSEFCIEIVRNLKCALKLLLHAVKQSYFPSELKQVFLCFLQNPNPALNSCCPEVDEILSALSNHEANL